MGSDFKEGFVFGFLISMLITIGLASWIRDKDRNDCDNKLPRTEKCVQIWVPEKSYKDTK